MISAVDQEPLAGQEAIDAIGEVARHLLHLRAAGVPRHAGARVQRGCDTPRRAALQVELPTSGFVEENAFHSRAELLASTLVAKGNVGQERSVVGWQGHLGTPATRTAGCGTLPRFTLVTAQSAAVLARLDRAGSYLGEATRELERGLFRASGNDVAASSGAIGEATRSHASVAVGSELKRLP